MDDNEGGGEEEEDFFSRSFSLSHFTVFFVVDRHAQLISSLVCPIVVYSYNFVLVYVYHPLQGRIHAHIYTYE